MPLKQQTIARVIAAVNRCGRMGATLSRGNATELTFRVPVHRSDLLFEVNLRCSVVFHPLNLA